VLAASIIRVIALMMDYQTTRRYDPEDSHLQFFLKFFNYFIFHKTHCDLLNGLKM
jgi:hypothetical protein